MYLVVTRVPVREGSIERLAELFDETNRELVAPHPDWLGASFAADRDANEIVVVARWREAASYARLRDSEAFAETMARFAPDFTRAPEVTVCEVLVEM